MFISDSTLSETTMGKQVVLFIAIMKAGTDTLSPR